jgi:phenylacetate-coenzyme A ligase PaaK-like adenylate-forming protein
MNMHRIMYVILELTFSFKFSQAQKCHRHLNLARNDHGRSNAILIHSNIKIHADTPHRSLTQAENASHFHWEHIKLNKN